MFSVHNPGKMFSEHVLGTQAFILRALWNVLGTHSRLANHSVFNRTFLFLKFLKPQKTERSVFGILRFVAFHAIQYILSLNFLSRYAPNCTIWSPKMQKLPTVGGGTPPCHTLPPLVASLPRAWSLRSLAISRVLFSDFQMLASMPFVQVENGKHLGLRSMTYCVYTAQRVRSFWCALSVLIAVCVLSPAHLEHCSGYMSVHTCFGCVLRGRFVPRTWFDDVPAGTVLAGTILFRTPFRLQEMVCTENMFREHVPAGTVPRTSMNARLVIDNLMSCLKGHLREEDNCFDHQTWRTVESRHEAIISLKLSSRDTKVIRNNGCFAEIVPWWSSLARTFLSSHHAGGYIVSRKY